MKTVIVVESPAKAKKISTFFRDAEGKTIVTSSFGHIYDLPKKSLSINIENNFEPDYQPLDGKGKVIKELKRYSKDHRVLLAADDDREGDAIAWHCGKIMKVNFNDKNRIIFHEVSKAAIEKAIQNVHQLDMNSVNAQQARRIIDRLVGYSLSPLLWKHIQTSQKGLSAGRVQSTLLLILQEYEKQIEEYNPDTKYVYTGIMMRSKGKDIQCEFNLINETIIPPIDIIKSFRKNRNYIIQKQFHKQEKKDSGAPFITSSLQQSAQQELGYNVKTTMEIAQKLYENGKITYMRTDSTNVSKEFQGLIRSHINETYGQEYYQYRKFGAKKVRGAQEAHECIRVTKVNEKLNDRYTEYDRKLYNLIRKRTICAFMSSAVYDTLMIQLSNDETSSLGYFIGTHRVLTFDGYLKYMGKQEVQEIHKDYPEDAFFTLKTALGKETTRNPPQYPNESSIVKKLEKSGIGRPSTYASIISTLYNRKYTEITDVTGFTRQQRKISLCEDDSIREETTEETSPLQKKRILLTDLGKQVLHYLLQNFSMIVNVNFTAAVEDDLDLVAHGELEWQSVVQKVYDSFYKDLQIQNSVKTVRPDKPKKFSKEIGEYEGEKVILREGQYGLYLSIGKRNVGLSNFLKDNDNNEVKANDITLEMVKDIIPYPMYLGDYKKHPVNIHIGPYGKYMKYRNKNFRIPQKDKYTLEEVIQCI
tara:strand:+ start:611 stop:2713 length:2103 start_codon:yes stop_codon:yes gene_type:complete